MVLYVVRFRFSRSIYFDKIFLKLIILIEYMIVRITFIIDIFRHINKQTFELFSLNRSLCYRIQGSIETSMAYRIEYQIDSAQMCK